MSWSTCSSERGVTLAGSGTYFHQTYLAAQKAADHLLFPEVRCFPGGGAPKPVPLYWEMKELFDAPIVSGYGLTEVPILTMGTPDRPRRGPGRDRGLAHARGGAEAGQAGRVDRRRGRGGRGPGQGPAAHGRLPGRRPRRRRLRRGRLLPHRRSRDAQRAQHVDDHRAAQGRDHPQGRERERQGGRGSPLHPSPGGGRGRDRRARRGAGGDGGGGRAARRGGRAAGSGRAGALLQGGRAHGPEDPRADRGGRRSSPATRRARSSSSSCATPTEPESGPDGGARPR